MSDNSEKNKNTVVYYSIMAVEELVDDLFKEFGKAKVLRIIKEAINEARSLESPSKDNLNDKE